jgi:hypothetical protein
LRDSQKDDLAQFKLPTTLPASPYQQVAAFVRIAWPPSVGISGRLASESVAAFRRIA